MAEFIRQGDVVLIKRKKLPKTFNGAKAQPYMRIEGENGGVHVLDKVKYFEIPTSVGIVQKRYVIVDYPVKMVHTEPPPQPAHPALDIDAGIYEVRTAREHGRRSGNSLD